MQVDYDPTWTPQRALREQVEKEDWLRWALKPKEPFKPIPPMAVEKWELPSLHALVSKIKP
jgi:hypothetical protein